MARKYKKDSVWLGLLAGLFGRLGVVAYLMANPYTSAQQAKDRLAWCVKARRDGGYWMAGKERRRTYRQGHAGGPVIAKYMQSARWVHA